MVSDIEEKKVGIETFNKLSGSSGRYTLGVVSSPCFALSALSSGGAE